MHVRALLGRRGSGACSAAARPVIERRPCPSAYPRFAYCIGRSEAHAAHASALLAHHDAVLLPPPMRRAIVPVRRARRSGRPRSSYSCPPSTHAVRHLQGKLKVPRVSKFVHRLYMYWACARAVARSQCSLFIAPQCCCATTDAKGSSGHSIDNIAVSSVICQVYGEIFATSETRLVSYLTLCDNVQGRTRCVVSTRL